MDSQHLSLPCCLQRRVWRVFKDGNFIRHFVHRDCHIGWKSKYCFHAFEKQQSACLQDFPLSSLLNCLWLFSHFYRGVSSFNQFIHESDSDSESETESEYESGLEDNNSLPPSSPASQTSHFSRASSVHSRHEHRHSSSFWKRVFRKLTCPFHAWYFSASHFVSYADCKTVNKLSIT
jgi:hypothetical protein